MISAFDPELESLGATLVLQAAARRDAGRGRLHRREPGEPGHLRLPEALGLRRPAAAAVGLERDRATSSTSAARSSSPSCSQPEQEDVTRELGVDEGTLGAIAAGVLIIVVAPISEEIFFRGFIFAGLRRAVPFVVAALISAAIWGIFHYTGADSWGVVVQLAVFGIVLAWLYERTGSIWPTIAVHAFNNAVAFTILTTT